MAHSRSTTNYKLSQFAGTDKPAWLVDYNADMLAIDTNLKSVSDTASGASSAIPSIQADLDNVEVTANSAESKSTSALSNIAKTYNATSTYSVGDKVLYNNLLYKCITPISTAESFDGTKWKRVILDEIITDVNSDLSKLNRSLTILNGSVLTYRPVTLNLSRNEAYRTDSYGNFILPNSINENFIISIRVLGGNYMNKLGYNPSLGYYCHVENVDGNPVKDTTVTVDVLYIPNAFD